MTLEDISFNMILEGERRKTFKFWPFDDNAKCNIAKMAEAGFYSSGKKSEPDFAVCYTCGKELDGWERDDDPWKEHQKHASHCPFINLGKKPSMLTVNDVLHLDQQRKLLKATRRFNEQMQEYDEHAAAALDAVRINERKENEKPRGT